MRFTFADIPSARLQIARAFDDLHRPMQPAPVFACSTAQMPPAADFPNCVLRNTTLNILAVSDGTDWRRQDTGATI